MVADCSVDYAGRLSAHLPRAKRVLMLKGDGSILVHSDGGSYKPLNWMSPPCSLEPLELDDDVREAGIIEQWQVTHKKTADKLVVSLFEIIHDSSYDLGVDPGLIKDGVEAHLQELLADQINLLGDGHSLVRREYMTAIGPVDILARDSEGVSVAVEIKRRGEIDGANVKPHAETVRARHTAIEIKRIAGIDAVEQLTRYLELLNRDPVLAPVRGVLAAQQIKPQARTLAEDRGIECLVLDYDAMRGMEDKNTLF